MDCQTFDPLRCAFGEAMPSGAATHLEACGLCKEEVAKISDQVWRVPLDTEMAVAFGTMPLDALAECDGFRGRTVSFQRVGEIVPLLIDEGREGGTFVRFEQAPLDSVRLNVTVPKGQLVPIGIPVKVSYTLDEDADTLVVHRNGSREVQLLFPTSYKPAPFWRAGTVSFTGTIEGHHGERQQFVILATKSRVLPERIPFCEPTQLAVIYHEALERARTLPQDQWCKAVLPYTAVDLNIVERYRQLDDLNTLENACLHEIQDREDWAKAACGEVCYRLLSRLHYDNNDQDDSLHRLFRAITEKLIRYWVGHWRHTWEEEVLNDAIQEVYAEFYKTARRHPLKFIHSVETARGQWLQLPCYTILLAFLKRISIRVAFAEWRQQRRSEVQAFLRFMHREAPKLSPTQKELFRTWVLTHVVEGEVEKAIFDGVLAGIKPQKLLENPAIQQAFQHVLGQSNKQLANSRDALLRRVWKTMRQWELTELPELLFLIRHLNAEVAGCPQESPS